jgi:imidazolonepropionase
MTYWDNLWINAHLATMNGDAAPYGAIPNGAVACKNERIEWVGPMSELPGNPDKLADDVIDVSGRWITPGLIDCHTHLVFGGNRAGEFEMRLQGASYEEIARAGGGIVSTMKATREATGAELTDAAFPRLSSLVREGVTTVEIKSGYGLQTATELKQLRSARELGQRTPVDVKTTFLGAHALPPEFEGKSSEYIDLVTEEMLPAVVAEGLADTVDGFCESIGFSPAEIETVFIAARKLGLPVKLHAEQLSDLGGAALAAKYGALSADHLEYISESGVRALAEAGTVAVVLPGAFYTLRETQFPPFDLFRKHNVEIAIGTDFNPGSSPIPSLLLMLNLGCTLFRLTPEEALTGVTRAAARALGLLDDRGTLTVGKRCDLAIWNIEQPAELAYWGGYNPIHEVIRGGKVSISRQSPDQHFPNIL